jgi:hypothetical protein
MGATQVLFEGVPTYPTAGRCWEVIDKYAVTQFYTAPTAIRSLMAAGNSHVEKNSRKSLRILGTVGEPINPEAWRWYHEVRRRQGGRGSKEAAQGHGCATAAIVPAGRLNDPLMLGLAPFLPCRWSATAAAPLSTLTGRRRRAPT